MLDDMDPDVVRSAALALAGLGDRQSTAHIQKALDRATYVELRIDLAYALTQLGSTTGVPVLLDYLDYPDDLVRETCFEKFFAATGLHRGYEIDAMHEIRLAAIGRLRMAWAEEGGPHRLKRVVEVEAKVDELAFKLMTSMGGGDVTVPAAEDDAKVIDELVALGEDAVPALIKGLKLPAGFAGKRASILTALARIGSKRAAPFVAATLRDPVLGVASYAAFALESCGDADCVPALHRYEARVRGTAAAGKLPANIPSPDPLLAQAARARLALGDDSARADLVRLLMSQIQDARTTAIDTLERKYGDRRGYDPAADRATLLQAASRWQR